MELKCKSVSQTNLNQNNILYVYIGPAALCPCPNINSQFIVITGDQGVWVEPLIELRSQKVARGEANVQIKHNIIGKSGTTKTWYSFNQPFLNGIFPKDSINWCNPACNIESTSEDEITAEKLEILIQKCGMNAEKIHLCIAQSNPILTIKRAHKLLQRCVAIDLSLHPLADIWKNSIEQYLNQKNFKNSTQEQLFWINDLHRNEFIAPLAEQSQSENFLNKTVKILLNNINLDDYREHQDEINDLDLSRLIATGKKSLQSNTSIRGLISSRLHSLLNRQNRSFATLITNVKSARNIKKSRQVETTKMNAFTKTHKNLRGNIDSLDKTRLLRGWVDSSDFGEGISQINVLWEEENKSIAIGSAIIERPDLRQIGIKNTQCGFEIEIKKNIISELADGHKNSASLCVVESKSGLLIGNQPWVIPENTIREMAPSLKGHIDGFEGAHTIRGWVDSSDFGNEISEVNVLWEEKNELVGQGIANLDRPDLLSIDIQDTQCGFSIKLRIFSSFRLTEILDAPINLCLVEQKSGQLIGGQPWKLPDYLKAGLLIELITESIEEGSITEIEDYLQETSNSYFSSLIRRRLLEVSAIRCRVGRWNEAIIKPIIKSKFVNPNLDYGSMSESASRLELLLLSTIVLTDYIDDNKINNINASKILADESSEDIITRVTIELRERQFVGLQGWEKRFWQHYLRPLNFAFIATLFLQSSHKKINKITGLLDTLASIAETPFGSNDLAYYLRSIVNVQNGRQFEQGYINLMQSRGDRFNLLLATYANSLNLGSQDQSQDITYLTATIDFAGGAPTTYAYLVHKLQKIFSDHLIAYPKQSIVKHWIDRLGHVTSSETQSMVGQMLRLGLTKANVIDFHNQMITIKQSLAELIWCNSDLTGSSNISKKVRHSSIKRWLIIGEKDLTQCWMYRVEQKMNQLEQIGCEVRCIDHEELKTWSFTHDMIWADALIVCRLPAMYHVFRAIAFARNCGIKIYSEIDDLLFTPDYPADYQSYGGSIPLSQYKNLCVDYPLRLGVINYADEIIVSTNVLAEYCHEVITDKQKPIHTLPNLPLEALLSFSRLYQDDKNWEEKKEIQKIALTSGTLSHKQILKETVYPALLEVLRNHHKAELSIVGHVDLPSEFRAFKDRISIVPFTDYTTYLQLLNECTIMLVPLEIHQTTHGKSAIKWMEASLCGVASICSPVRAYTDVTTSGEDVIIAKTTDDWRDAMSYLLDNPKDRETIARRAFTHSNIQFNSKIGTSFWIPKVNTITIQEEVAKTRKKILVINVFFAPQSIGGATRVAQDYVKKMADDKHINHDITVLCVDYANWQSGLKSDQKKQNKELTGEDGPESNSDQNSTRLYSPLSTTLEEIDNLSENLIPDKIDYHDQVHVDISYWNEARIVRLNIQPKSWEVFEDDAIEAFCEEFFETEAFDFIQCHCCQILTASPLIVARRMSIPYEIILHDAWWMSSEQFLVSKAGRLIDPANPLDHFDQEPTEEERDLAFERRQVLYEILENAERRVAVSSAFKAVCESAGIADISVQENEVTSMKIDTFQKEAVKSDKNYLYKLCHIGGMSLHKGYQLLRRAVHELPPNLPFQFTIIDHRLMSSADHYISTWNGYEINFLAPIPMDEMSIFYSNHDVLIAPSIWPESFGLVSREALSAGLWVIASNSGALAEPILQSSQHVGQVIRPNQLQDLIDAIIEIPEKMKAKS